MIANHDDSIVRAYRGIAEAVHRHDCRIMSQLTHLGRRAQSDVESMHVLLAPSQIPEKVHREVPHEMEPEHIQMIVRAFGDAALRCREGGLDGVEMSFAHNHLVDQFWSPLFNRRTDEYGGSLENRMRFGFEVLREVRRQVGRDWVVGVRITGDEMTHRGLSANDMADIARRLAASGLVDFFSIVGGAAHTAVLQAVLTPDLGQNFPSVFYFTYFGYHVGAIVAASFLVFGCRLYPRPGAVWWVFPITLAWPVLSVSALIQTMPMWTSTRSA